MTSPTMAIPSDKKRKQVMSIMLQLLPIPSSVLECDDVNTVNSMIKGFIESCGASSAQIIRVEKMEDVPYVVLGFSNAKAAGDAQAKLNGVLWEGKHLQAMTVSSSITEKDNAMYVHGKDGDGPENDLSSAFDSLNLMCNEAKEETESMNIFNVFVGDIGYNVDDATLYETFSCFRNLKSVRIMRDAVNKSRGYGFLTFTDRSSAERSIHEMNGKVLQQRILRLAWANGVQHSVRGGLAGDYYGGVDTRNRNSTPKQIETVLLESPPGNTTVYVGGLPEDIEEGVLRAAFSPFGGIDCLHVHADRGFAFVHYTNRYDAATAIVSMHGNTIGGSVIRCWWGRKAHPFTGYGVRGGYDWTGGGNRWPAHQQGHLGGMFYNHHHSDGGRGTSIGNQRSPMHRHPMLFQQQQQQQPFMYYLPSANGYYSYSPSMTVPQSQMMSRSYYGYVPPGPPNPIQQDFNGQGEQMAQMQGSSPPDAMVEGTGFNGGYTGYVGEQVQPFFYHQMPVSSLDLHQQQQQQQFFQHEGTINAQQYQDPYQEPFETSSSSVSSTSTPSRPQQVIPPEGSNDLNCKLDLEPTIVVQSSKSN